MTRLETATHITLLALAGTAGALMLEQRFWRQPTASTRADVEQSLRGTSLRIPGIDWNSSPEGTLVLQISATCPYCVANEPFYKKLVSARDASGKKIGVVVLTADDTESLRAHLQIAGIIVDKVVHVTGEATGTALTPVVFYVKPTGLVERAFVGQLDESQQAQVSELLKL